MKEPKTKICRICGIKFSRKKKYSDAQWDKTLACSRRCGAIKRNVSNDKDIVSMYIDGMSCDEIAKHSLMSSTHVGRILHEYGVDVDQYRLKKGGIHINEYGYLRFDDSKSNGKNAGRRLHSLIMEMKIGRMMTRKEVVHHKDGDKLNNHPDNLQLMGRGEHTTFHKKGKK